MSRKPGRSIAVSTTIILIVIALLFISSCGGGATVVIKDLTIEPQKVTIKAGEAVTWKNEDRRSHQIMSGAPPVMTDDFMSPVLQKGDSWSYTFDEPGEYAYHSMTGSLLGWVIVEE